MAVAALLFAFNPCTQILTKPTCISPSLML